MAFQVLLAGQDITNHMDQLTLNAVDALGQSSGAGSSAVMQGRAGTIQFNSDLGPMNTAHGAGQTLPGVGGPFLVRQGEIIIKDATGATIWGGYATKYTDTTTSVLGNTLRTFTTIEGTDYEATLDRVMVNASYVGLTDVQIIAQVLGTYAPWISTALLPTTGIFTFPVRNFRNVSVRQVLQTIAGITGYMIWVDFSKFVHYVSPASASSAPFFLSSTPDFITSFPHNVQEFITDDNAAIDRVYFYGGMKPSGDFTQDVSPLANGNNKIFPTAYYPRPTSDGLFHVTVNAAEKVVGFATGASTPANTLKSAGGLADCLINPDSHNVTFDIAPATGNTVLIKYQYQFPFVVIVTDENAHSFFGSPYLDGYISDGSVFDAPTAIQRCKVLLSQQSFGLTSLKIDCWRPGLRSGQTIRVVNTVRGINASYLIQEVETEPLGAGNFVYHLTLGAWNWNALDIMVKLAQGQALSDTSSSESPSLLLVIQSLITVHANATWGTPKVHTGNYYARAAALGDGHDSFPGLATIASNL